MTTPESLTDHCDVKLLHGPGHQSETPCEVIGPHEQHEATYWNDRGSHRAVWAGGNVFTDYFDNPPGDDPEYEDHRKTTPESLTADDVDELAGRFVAAGSPFDILTRAGWRVMLMALSRFPDLRVALATLDRERTELREALHALDTATDHLIDEHLDKAGEFDFGFPAVLVDDIRSAQRRLRAALNRDPS